MTAVITPALARWAALAVAVVVVAAVGIAWIGSGDPRTTSVLGRGAGKPAVADIVRAADGKPEPPLGGLGSGFRPTYDIPDTERSAALVAQAASICEAARDRFRSAVASLGFPRDDGAVNAAAIRAWARALADLRELTRSGGDRPWFDEFTSLIAVQIDMFRRAATAARFGETAFAGRLQHQVLGLTHAIGRHYPGLRACPMSVER